MATDKTQLTPPELAALVSAALAAVGAGLWLDPGRTAALLAVPSVIVPGEPVVVINTSHKDAPGLRACVVRPFDNHRPFRGARARVGRDTGRASRTCHGLWRPAGQHIEPAITRVPGMTATITAFAASPDRGRGLARDMPVRWAFEEVSEEVFEEVGEPYDVRLVSFAAMKEPGHLALQRLGQIPTCEAGGLGLFESGAIVLHIAERHGGLPGRDAHARARAVMWMFAAVSTMEPTIVQRESAVYFERDEPWYPRRLAMVEDRIRVRLAELSARLGGAEWLDGAFSAGDLLMAQVLRRLGGTGLLDEQVNLVAYGARAEARPAFKRAFEAQLRVFTNPRA